MTGLITLYPSLIVYFYPIFYAGYCMTISIVFTIWHKNYLGSVDMRIVQGGIT